METGPYNADEVAHVKKCAPMLPEPGAYIASRLLDTIDALVKERDEARDALVGLKSLHAEDGRVDAKFAGEFVKAFSAGFVQMYRDSGAKNYLDIKFVDRTTGETFTVTVQRDLGKTAHALRTEAEAERDAATARADKAEAEARTQSVLAAQARTLARMGMDSEAERNAVLVVQLRAAKDKAEKDRDDAYRAGLKAAEDFANATGRVSQSNLDLRGLLREAKDHVESVTLRERIDAALDRKGGDGAIEGGRE